MEDRGPGPPRAAIWRTGQIAARNAAPGRLSPAAGPLRPDGNDHGVFRSQLVHKAFEKPSGRPDLNRRPLDPQDMGLAVLTGHWGSDGPALGALTCWLSAQMHSVWSQNGPKLPYGEPAVPSRCEFLAARSFVVAEAPAPSRDLAFSCPRRRRATPPGRRVRCRLGQRRRTSAGFPRDV
jgi:hypothetical protein